MAPELDMRDVIERALAAQHAKRLHMLVCINLAAQIDRRHDLCDVIARGRRHRDRDRCDEHEAESSKFFHLAATTTLAAGELRRTEAAAALRRSSAHFSRRVGRQCGNAIDASSRAIDRSIRRTSVRPGCTCAGPRAHERAARRREPPFILVEQHARGRTRTRCRAAADAAPVIVLASAASLASATAQLSAAGSENGQHLASHQPVDHSSRAAGGVVPRSPIVKATTTRPP